LNHNDANTTIAELLSYLRKFLAEREWEKYHNLKDVAESICIEAAELLQLFQWIRSQESVRFKHDQSRIQRVREELAEFLFV